MAETATKKVRYVGNNSNYDKTARIRLRKPDRDDLVLGGAPGEVTDEEFARLSGRHQLEVVGAESAEPSESSPQRSQPGTPAAERKEG